MSESPIRADGSNFLWLADAPLFIDADRVSRFYDAVVRPKHKQKDVEVNFNKEAATNLRAELTGGVEAALKLPAFLSFLDATASVEAGGGAETQQTESEGHTVVLERIETPQRQLEDLVVYYLGNHKDRIFLAGDRPFNLEWRESGVITAAPKAVLMIDLPGLAEAEQYGVPRTKIIPVIAEFSNGHVELIFRTLRAKSGEFPPKYPDLESSDDHQSIREKQRDYWKWYEDNFDPRQAMEELEKAGAVNGRIRWIAYRLPLTEDGDTLHLTLWANESYHTGDLAYNLIKRGYKHGLRLVGTLKSEPDLNVLAIFEK